MEDFTYFKEQVKKSESGKINILPDYSNILEGSYDLLGDNGKIYENATFTREYNNDKSDLSTGIFFVCYPASVNLIAYRKREV